MLEKRKKNKLSAFMTKILRHSPQDYGILLTDTGACKVSDLLIALSSQDYWKGVTEDDIIDIVNSCEKQRYELKDGLIRARYGHSFKKIDYKESIPPKTLLHGTHKEVVEIILKEGIKKMNRQYVHLSATEGFASLAGKRRGELALLEVDTKKATDMGVKFYYAGNEVWLSDFIPSEAVKKRTP